MKQRNFYGVSICNSAAQSSGTVQVCGETMLTDVHGRVAVRVLAHYVNASWDLRRTTNISTENAQTVACVSLAAEVCTSWACLTE